MVGAMVPPGTGFSKVKSDIAKGMPIPATAASADIARFLFYVLVVIFPVLPILG